MFSGVMYTKKKSNFQSLAHQCHGMKVIIRLHEINHKSPCQSHSHVKFDGAASHGASVAGGVSVQGGRALWALSLGTSGQVSPP